MGRSCAIIAKSVAAGTGTSEQVSKPVIAGETIAFFIDNRSSVNQAAAWRIALEP